MPLFHLLFLSLFLYLLLLLSHVFYFLFFFSAQSRVYSTLLFSILTCWHFIPLFIRSIASFNRIFHLLCETDLSFSCISFLFYFIFVFVSRNLFAYCYIASFFVGLWSFALLSLFCFSFVFFIIFLFFLLVILLSSHTVTSFHC